MFKYTIYMSKIPKTFSRPLRMEDLFDEPNIKNKNQHNKNDTIAKNQQEFGQRKRIKP